MHETTGEKIDVMGHSQGELEARWVINWFPAGAFVDDHSALATPHHGASTFDKATAKGHDIEAGWQMRTDSSFLTALKRGDETPGAIDYTNLYSKTDELIQPVGTPPLEGATNILLQDLCPGRRVDHGGIAADDVTYRLVIDALTHTGAAKPGRATVKLSGFPPRRGKASVRTAPERGRSSPRRSGAAAGALCPWLTIWSTKPAAAPRYPDRSAASVPRPEAILV
jgi:hypothetical protein